MSDMDLILPEEEPKSAKEAAKRAKQLAEEEAKVEAAEAEAQKAKAASMEDAAVPAEELAVEPAEEPAEEPEKMDGEEHHHHHHHHHSHHEHHHNSGGNRKKRRKKKSKFSRFLRYNKKKLLWASLAVFLVVVMLVLASMLDKFKSFQDNGGGVSSTVDPTPSTSTSKPSKESGMQIKVPLFTEEVSLAMPCVKAYMTANVSVPANELFNRSRGEDKTKRLDVALPVTLSYEVMGLPDGYSVKGARVYVSEDSDFTNAQPYTVTAPNTKVDVYHLKTGTQYHYRIDLNLSDGSVTGISGTFKTAQTPRILSIEGVNNVRDIGGWDTASGERVKQGLLYRGGELDGSVDVTSTITTNGLNMMLAELGVRTDMDLRYATDNASGVDALGVGVEHIYYNTSSYVSVFEERNHEPVRRLFSDLSDRSKYPVYLHCTAGTDRTGTMCYVLGALLGVSKDDLIRDFNLSSLIYGPLYFQGSFQEFVTAFDGLEGETLQQKAETYLLSIGVTSSEINSIRDIFL